MWQHVDSVGDLTKSISPWKAWTGLLRRQGMPCASRKVNTRKYFNWTVCLTDNKNVIQTNRLLFWAYHHLLWTMGCQLSKQLSKLLFITS